MRSFLSSNFFAALALSFAFLTTAAASAQPAQPPPPPQPRPIQQGQPPRPPPGAQPGAQPGRAQQAPLPPSMLPPGHPSLGQGQPGQAGQPPRGPTIRKLPGPPPGFGGQRPLPQSPPKAAHAAEEEHAEAHAEHCPGHGPYDAPGPVNWWHGMLGVNNDAAKFETDDHGHEHRVDSFGSQLLWRYENKEDACDHKNEAPPFFANVLNLAVLGFVLVRFGRKPLQDALVKRKQDIMREIDTAATLRRESKERLADYQAKLERIEETLADMREEYAAQAEAEKKRLLAEAEERRARMTKDAEFRVEQERKAARIEVMREAVDQAVAGAHAILAKQVAKADNERFNDEYLVTASKAFGRSTSANDASTGGAA